MTTPQITAELTRCLEAAQEVIHLAHCRVGDAGGNTECWKECREATAIISKAVVLDFLSEKGIVTHASS